MALKKQRVRTETIGVRMSPKIRYGLELVSRKNRDTLSQTMLRALEEYLEKDGIAAKHQGEMLSLLDKLWSESESERVVNVVGSGYEIPSDIAVANVIGELDKEFKKAKPNWSYAKSEFYSICDQNETDILAASAGHINFHDLALDIIHDQLGDKP